MSSLYNPLTHRPIKSGGATHKKLSKKSSTKSKKTTSTSSKSTTRVHRLSTHERIVGKKSIADTMKLPVGSKLSLEKQMKRYQPPHLQHRYEKLKAHEGEGRGSRTRGWALGAPKRGKERQEKYAQCGDACFLAPSTLSFPVCRYDEGCKLSCEGLQSAKNRAGQWKYADIRAKADRLLRAKC
jgi:hypothetical protein